MNGNFHYEIVLPSLSRLVKSNKNILRGSKYVSQGMIHVPEATAHELMNMGKENDDQVEYDLNGWIEKRDSKNEKKRKDEMTFQQI